ncbi:hypothetical protein C2G38_2031010 [Gigaspora rosea]|uniref:F-box domain-containing protein n=1 Tax=Gigaspora rosea TaxID=44941 RepID=A0A397VZM2_9GLOM|nr:hypothetical protein C2G38_2031010 [Gigaspora rosea]
MSCFSVLLINQNFSCNVLAKNNKTISSLDLVIYSDFESRLYHSLFHAIIRIIKLQDRIKRFSLDGEDHPKELYGIISALECQKNSLQEVIIAKCAYNKEFEVLAKNNKTISSLDLVIYSDFESRLYHSLFHAIIRIIKLQDRIKRFSLDGEDHPKELYGIISALECQKNSLQEVIIAKCAYNKEFERLRFNPNNSEDIHKELFFLEALKSFCPNITYLYISNIWLSTQLLEIIGNLQKLQSLSLWCFISDIQEEELKIQGMQFAEILPLTLQYLDLGDTWQPYIDIFLIHCNAPLKKLLIYHLNDEKYTRALIEFCIRNKALNYVGVCRYYSDLDENFKKEVEAHFTNVALVPRARIVEFL